MSQLLPRSEALFIIDDIIPDESFDKLRESLFKLISQVGIVTIYSWLLTESYSGISKNLRRQAKAVFAWYPKERTALKMIHDENNALTDNELFIGREFLKLAKCTCFYMRNENPVDLRY